MSSEAVIRFCAPTLAGLKVSNLFSTRFENIQKLNAQIAHYNKLLNFKGIYVEIMRIRDNVALILVYRKSKLREVLSEEVLQKFLSKHGYDDFDIEACFKILRAHLMLEDFPHEIGVFLGYPLADIEAFIANKGLYHKCVGCWKVYTNEEDAKKTFAKFDKCTRIYCEKFRQGTEITQLAVAV